MVSLPDGWKLPSWEEPSLSGAGCFITLNGASTTGKTFSALRMATGFANAAKGEIACIDTEAKRMSHYYSPTLSKDKFPFRVFDMQPPFHPMRFATAAEDAEKRGFAALVIDSFSMEWIGEGGVLRLFDEEIGRRVAKDRRELPDDVKAAKHNQVGWKFAKAPHTEMKLSLMQRRIPIIFCLRAEKKLQLPTGGGEAVDLGWVASQDERWLYEWTVSFTFDPETPGVPRRDIRVKGRPGWKCEAQHAHLFPDRQFITEAAGEGLWRWAHGLPFGPDWLKEAYPATQQVSRKTRPATTAAADDRLNASASVASAAALHNTRTEPEPENHPDSSSPSIPPDGKDIFPGDLPSKHEEPDRKFASAGEFAHEMVADIRRQREQDHLRLLLNKKSVRHRMDRLRESYPELHRSVMDAVAQRTAELGAPS